MKERHLAVLLFSVVMLITNFLQILNSLFPVYAMGCLIGTVILHVYIVEDEREEYRQIIAREKNALDAGMNGHLAKPIDIPKLLSTLSQLKGRKH